VIKSNFSYSLSFDGDAPFHKKDQTESH